LKPVPGYDIRPTPDRLRETLFDVLATRIEGAVFVDAYAGTGAVGIEAVSRGARQAVLIERDRGALKVMEENVASLGIGNRVQIIGTRATIAITRVKADIVFLDPPYEQPREYAALLELLGDDPPALVIAQHAARSPLEDRYGKLERYRTIRQGDNALSFYSPFSEGQD
jgi:16S rRNA (guanine966-N2)-methyltransferase